MYLVLLSLWVQPVSAGSVEGGDGPLLFLVRTSGAPVVKVVEAGSGAPASVLARGWSMVPEARLDRERVLVSLDDGLAVVDLGMGRVNLVEPNEGANLLAVDHARGEILFYAQPERSGGFIGIALEPLGEDYRAVEWDRSSATLHAVPEDLSEPARPLFDRPVQRVITASEDPMLVVEANDASTLWSVPRDGSSPRSIADLDPGWMLALSTSALSPNGRLLAFGAAHRDRYYHSRDLVVLDLETGERVVDHPEIPATVSPLSSFAPRLHLTWVGDRVLRHCETYGDVDEDFSNAGFQWVDLDVETGERLTEHRYAKVGLRHVPPPADPVPPFPSEDEEAGDPDVIEVSPDGRWELTGGRRTLWLREKETGDQVRVARGQPERWDVYWLTAIE